MKRIGILAGVISTITAATLLYAGIATKPYTFVNGTTADATQVNSNFDTLYTTVNGNLENINIKGAAGIIFSKLDAATVAGVAAVQNLLNKTLTSPVITTAPTAAGATWTDLGTVNTVVISSGTINSSSATFTNANLITPKVKGAGTGKATLQYANSASDRTYTIPDSGTSDNFTMETSPWLPPVGTIIAHYDYNGLVTLNSAYWVYCDGSVINNASSPLNGQTLPDLSNRYLVGFGTEGGSDIDTAAWATAAVGNTIGGNHAVNLSHAHDSGTYAGPAHTHDGPSHTHEYAYWDGTYLNFQSGDAETYNYYIYTNNFSEGAGGLIGRTNIQTNFPGFPVGAMTHSAGTGATSSAGTGAVTGSSGNAGSATQSIQPRSVRVRYAIRIN